MKRRHYKKALMKLTKLYGGHKSAKLTGHEKIECFRTSNL